MLLTSVIKRQSKTNASLDKKVCGLIETNKELTEQAKLADVDHLTGLMNRRGFEPVYKNLLNLLPEENEEDRRKNTGMSGLGLMMIDADNFKLINDSHGHNVGDDVLKALSRTIEDSLPRESDVVCRWGGEEFIVVLPNVTLEKVEELAELVRAAVANIMFAGVSSISVSIGVSYTNYQIDSHDLISQADYALGQAKEAGKNQVVVCELDDTPRIIID
ncbi:MAG: GGDEF domain-containing protein [Candidatus Pacebacteria bacterium]|nr:GGDEF domain-containing protein [Candidatus Paceibacterota bacterium]